MKKVIFDTDGGGDDLWALLLLIDAHKHGVIQLLGITTCYGNTSLENASNNILNFLYHCGASEIPVFKGATKTLNGLRGLADNAFGANGLSKGSLPQSDKVFDQYSAHDFLTKMLSTNTDDNISIISTGPATNIAHVFKDNPEFDRSNIDILWMGGAVFPAGGNNRLIQLKNGAVNQGNITPCMEFNAGNDVPASILMTNLNKVQVTIMPMDPCQHAVFTPHYQDILIAEMKKIDRSSIADNQIALLQDVIQLDKMKQGMDGTPIYDAQTVQYYLSRDYFPEAISLEKVNLVDKEHLVPAFLSASDNGKYAPQTLEDHGLMSVVQTKHGEQSNIRIVPGPYTFNQNPEACDIATHVEMGEQREADLINRVVKASKNLIFT